MYIIVFIKNIIQIYFNIYKAKLIFIPKMKTFDLNEYHKYKKLRPTKINVSKSITKHTSNITNKNTNYLYDIEESPSKMLPEIHRHKIKTPLKLRTANSTYNPKKNLNMHSPFQNKSLKDKIYVTDDNNDLCGIKSTKVQIFKKNRKLKIKRVLEPNENINMNENSKNTFKIKMKGKKLLLPKHGYKLFTTTKIINNFNNQINENNELPKIKEIAEYPMDNISLLYQMEKNATLIQRKFRRYLFRKKNLNKINESKIFNKMNENNKEQKKDDVKQEKKIKVYIKPNNINDDDIISDISLSEEELNFSNDKEIINDFSIDDQEI